jgi:hypothetical protein
MSTAPTPRHTPPPPPPRHRFGFLWATRYLLPGIVCLVGIVFFAIDPSDNLEGSAGLVGAGLSIALLNVLFRFGVQSDRDRAREDAARAYYDAHGYWPDERRPDERRERQS